jgi:hypothetical protein
MKAEERREEQEAINSFVQGAIQGDFELFDSGIDVVEEHCGWRCFSISFVRRNSSLATIPAAGQR